MRRYEGMILLDSLKVATKWEEYLKEIHDMLARRGGIVLKSEKWAERKLAYEIKGHKRATYLLVHFDMPSENIVSIRRDFQLCEFVLRHMILFNEKGNIEPIKRLIEDVKIPEDTEPKKENVEPKKEETKEEPKKENVELQKEETKEEPKKEESTS